MINKKREVRDMLGNFPEIPQESSCATSSRKIYQRND
jgi:hypothetical protein